MGTWLEMHTNKFRQGMSIMVYMLGKGMDRVSPRIWRFYNSAPQNIIKWKTNSS